MAGVGLLLALQIGLGITNVIAPVSLSIAVAHNIFTAFLLGGLVCLAYVIWTSKQIDTGEKQ